MYIDNSYENACILIVQLEHCSMITGTFILLIDIFDSIGSVYILQLIMIRF